MLAYENTYNKYLITNWFVAILLICGIGGYTNYTPPISNPQTIELVISSEESNYKIVSNRNKLPLEPYFNYFSVYDSYLTLISQRHTSIYKIKNKEFTNSISLAVKYTTLLFTYKVLYAAEDSSFHLG